MAQDPSIRAHAQRDEWFVWDAPNRVKVTVDEAEAWPLNRAKVIAAELGGQPRYLVLHTLTWVNETEHEAWAKATDYGARPGPMTMRP